MRIDDRGNQELRPVTIQRRFTDNPGGSVLISMGQTRVLCTAMVEDGVPPFLINSGRGWLTAEYSMLPGSTPSRKSRDGRKGPPDGRGIEIQRLIGRCLRTIVNTKALGQRTVWVDCDVLQADGGTRTAAITGAYCAVHDALQDGLRRGILTSDPLCAQLAAVSVGVIEGEVRLDLSSHEDMRADVDMNIVMTSENKFVEVQGAAEKATFSQEQLDELLATAKKGISELFEIQRSALAKD